MGLHIQSDEFWMLRPDNFITMYLGYRHRQQQEQHALRRLMLLFSSANGGSFTEEDLYPLPFIDNFVERPVTKNKVVQHTAEEIEKIEAEHKRIYEQHKARKAASKKKST